MKLKKQVAIVTGGASGMGKATADWLHEQGVQVVVWDKNIDVLGNNPAFLAFACDVSSSDSVEATMAATIEAVGVPTICINCAGIVLGKRMVGKEGPMPLSAFKQIIDVNLVGTFNVMRVVASAMMQNTVNEEAERGVIINTASIAAFEGQIGQMAYSASKAGVVGMTLPAARELAQHGIRVNTIAPGLIATPMLQGMPDEVQESLIATTVFPKRLGKPEEFAALVGHIIENPLINGEVIRLDGAVRLTIR